MIKRPVVPLLAALLALLPPAAGAQLRLPSSAGDPLRLQSPAADPLRVGPLPAAPAPVAIAVTGPRLVDRVVAIVNNEAITERQLDRRTQAVGQRLRAQGTPLPPPDELRREVLERMILDRAQVQAARELGVRVDEATIDRAIQSIAREARLTVPEFRRQVESEGLTFAMFRDEVATEIAVNRLRERDFGARAQVSEAEIDAVLAEQSAAGGAIEYNVAQILVRVPEDAAPEVVARAAERAGEVAREARAGADLAALVARMSDGPDPVSGGVTGLRTADRLPALFVEAIEPLSINDVTPVLRSPAGFHVLKLLERRAGGVTQLAGAPVRQTRARHILVRVNELNPEAEVIRRLTEIRQRIEAGTASFADMARQYSVDGSAGQGGDLGWVYPGDTVPEFERAMDALAPGAVAGPVRSPFGYHLIQVVERRTDEASPERIRAAIRNDLRQRKAAEAFREWSEQVRDRAYVEYRLDER